MTMIYNSHEKKQSWTSLSVIIIEMRWKARSTSTLHLSWYTGCSLGNRRSENSPATTQISPAKFCLFPERALPFHNNPPLTLQYSPVIPILNENLGYNYSAINSTNLISSSSPVLNRDRHDSPINLNVNLLSVKRHS